MKLKTLHIALIFFLSLSQASQAASFDCSKATTLTEKVICSDKGLSALDEQVGTVYKAALKKPGVDVASLKDSQRQWLKSERNLCADVPCLTDTMHRRISLLSSVENLPASTPSNILLVLEPDQKTDALPKDVKTKSVELQGTVDAFHDEAGGSYGLVVGKKEYTIRYYGFLNDEQTTILERLKDGGSKVTVKGTLVIYRDGSAAFSDQHPIAIY